MSDTSRAEPGILVATSAFAATVDGRNYVIRRGDTIRDGHPLVKGRENHFAPFTISYELPEKPQKPAKPKPQKPAKPEK